uniref:40S ribosomal protein S27-like n=1 Tax=Equus asinus asinus TaxID=83772 RepID=A0A8C4MS84_EQUAS
MFFSPSTIILHPNIFSCPLNLSVTFTKLILLLLLFLQYLYLKIPRCCRHKRRCKKKRLVQSPNSYFMDVKCPGYYKTTAVFSHAQMVVLCVGCSIVLCQPAEGKARLTEGCSFRQKQH